MEHEIRLEAAVVGGLGGQSYLILQKHSLRFPTVTQANDIVQSTI